MTKIKLFVLIVIFTISVLGLYAEAPELRNVMPNSWRKVTRFSRDEEARFLRNNAGVLEKSIREGFNQADSSLLRRNTNVKETTLVYYEPIETEKFYRLITLVSDTDDFTKQGEIQFLQTLVYEFRGRMEILAIGGYNNGTVSESEIGEYKICKSLDIIRSGGRAKGVLTTRVLIPFNSYRKTYTFFVKGQPRGLNYSAYALMSDILEFSDIFRLGYINKIAIINGYAENPNLYKENNRIKRIKRGDDEISIIDGYLSYQFIDTPKKPQWIIVTDIYKGEKYNDTCIAELNVKTDKGWLFGDINE